MFYGFQKVFEGIVFCCFLQGLTFIWYVESRGLPVHYGNRMSIWSVQLLDFSTLARAPLLSKKFINLTSLHTVQSVTLATSGLKYFSFYNIQWHIAQLNCIMLEVKNIVFVIKISKGIWIGKIQPSELNFVQYIMVDFLCAYENVKVSSRISHTKDSSTTLWQHPLSVLQ